MVGTKTLRNSTDNSRLLMREAILAHAALVALAIIAMLAFFAPTEKITLADRIGLLFLAVVCGLTFWPIILNALEAQTDGATFLLCAMMFVIYGIARRVTPENGLGLSFVAMPEDRYIFPYSAYVVVCGAILTIPFRWRHRSQWTGAFSFGLGAIAFLAVCSFQLLSLYYPVGPAQRLDPSSLPTLSFMLVEYGCLALLCHTVGVHAPTRRIAFRVLPLVLIALWARYHFIKPVEEDE